MAGAAECSYRFPCSCELSDSKAKRPKLGVVAGAVLRLVHALLLIFLGFKIHLDFLW